MLEVQSSGNVPWRSREGSKVVKVRTWETEACMLEVLWRFRVQSSEKNLRDSRVCTGDLVEVQI